MTAEIEFNVAITNGAQIAAQLLGYGPRLEAEMGDAMQEIVDELSMYMVGIMHWQHTSGALELSVLEDSQVLDPWHAEIGSSRPYAARRNWGFSGMTDSLGRTYPDDPGAYYLDDTLEDNTAFIEDRINLAVYFALGI